LLHVAERLAEVKKVTLKQVEDITSQNARSLFHV
jgi:Tat protein secretion system quality control protein TatD with DNase activity